RPGRRAAERQSRGNRRDRRLHQGRGRRRNELRLRFGDPGQYKLRIISMREQQFRSDFSRGRLADRTNRTRAQGMLLSANHIHFFVSYAVAFLVFGLIGKWYLWPAIRERAPGIALTPLLLFACLRVNGLMFLMPGLVSPQLPGAFAVPVAYGDLTATVLGLLALACVRSENAAAVPIVWLFNIVGL